MMAEPSPRSQIVRARAPLRVGVAGGGTDLSPYADDHGGLVVNATLGLYAHCTLDFSGATVVFEATDFDLTDTLFPGGKVETAKLRLHAGVYERICADFLEGARPSVRISTYVDVPAGSGLGSSSALVVCLIKAFVEAFGLPLDAYGVAALAYEVERVDLGLSGGRQDQYAASFGGLNTMEFGANGQAVIKPLKTKNWILREFEESLILYFTGVSRDSATIIDDQIQQVSQPTTPQIDSMHRLKALAAEAQKDLITGDIAALARALHESWEAKKKTSARITNTDLDEVYAHAIVQGCLGGKISGAGGGGFMFLICPPERRFQIMQSLQRTFGGACHRAVLTTKGAEAWTV